MFLEAEEDENAEETKNDSSTSSSTAKNTPSNSSQLEHIIERLPTCVNKDFIDDVNISYNVVKFFKSIFEIAVEFICVFAYSLLQTLS